jgi:hypothetical protein
MQAFHELPGLGRRGLRETAAGSTDVRVRQVLAESGLSEQEESIKLSLQPMGGEEMSKMWTAFQAQYRPSVAYHASVVLIRSTRPAVSPLPVREPRLHVRTLRRPRIDAVSPQSVVAGDTLTLAGSGLRAETVRVLFGDVASPALLMVSEERIDATVPDGLRAGVNTVRVDQPIDVSAGGPPDLRRGVDSNAVAFMLAPRMVDPVPASAVRGSVLALTVDPLVERRQRAELLLGSTAIAREAPEGEAEATATLRFEIPAAFAVAPHLLRIRVDGAESPLDVDGEGRYAGPQLTVTAA